MVLMLVCLTGFIVSAATGNGVNTDVTSNDRVWNLGVISMNSNTYLNGVWTVSYTHLADLPAQRRPAQGGSFAQNAGELNLVKGGRASGNQLPDEHGDHQPGTLAAAVVEGAQLAGKGQHVPGMYGVCLLYTSPCSWRRVPWSSAGLWTPGARRCPS